MGPTNRERNVEVGRVCVVTYGQHTGKPVVITDIVDQARAVVMGGEGLLSDLKPQSFPIKRLHLTNQRVKGLIQRGHRLKKIKALLNADLDALKENISKDKVMVKITKRRAKVGMTDF